MCYYFINTVPKIVGITVEGYSRSSTMVPDDTVCEFLLVVYGTCIVNLFLSVLHRFRDTASLVYAVQGH